MTSPTKEAISPEVRVVYLFGAGALMINVVLNLAKDEVLSVKPIPKD